MGFLLTSLGDESGLPHLALIRMQGKRDHAEIDIARLVSGASRDVAARRGDAK